MSYKIKKAGYEFKGWKLGQRVMYQGQETTIIGFDERNERIFPIVVASSKDYEQDIKLDTCITTLLDVAHEINQGYEWASINEIATVKEKEKPMEKKMTKADLEGKWVRCTWKKSTNHYRVGDLLQIKDKLIISQDGCDKLFSWYENLKDGFTIAQLNKVLQTSYDTTVKFEYVGGYPSQGKIKFEDLKVGDKLTLRDDLVVGTMYGKTSYLFNMASPSKEVTVNHFDIGMERIYINECKIGYIYAPEMFEEILPLQTQNKVKSDEVKSDKKSKVSEIKTKLHVDLLFDKPVIEETKEEVYIFSGRTTIYINKSLGGYGVATCNSRELSSYNKEIGMSLAYRRCFLSFDKK